MHERRSGRFVKLALPFVFRFFFRAHAFFHVHLHKRAYELLPEAGADEFLVRIFHVSLYDLPCLLVEGVGVVKTDSAQVYAVYPRLPFFKIHAIPRFLKFPLHLPYDSCAKTHWLQCSEACRFSLERPSTLAYFALLWEHLFVF